MSSADERLARDAVTQKALNDGNMIFSRVHQPLHRRDRAVLGVSAEPRAARGYAVDGSGSITTIVCECDRHLTSWRVYECDRKARSYQRQGFTWRECWKEIVKCAGSIMAPEEIDVLLHHFSNDTPVGGHIDTRSEFAWTVVAADALREDRPGKEADRIARFRETANACAQTLTRATAPRVLCDECKLRHESSSTEKGFTTLHGNVFKGHAIIPAVCTNDPRWLALLISDATRKEFLDKLAPDARQAERALACMISCIYHCARCEDVSLLHGDILASVSSIL